MVLNVSASFLEVLKSIDKDVLPRAVVEWIEWAAEHSEEAEKIAENYKKLGRVGKAEFKKALWCEEEPSHAIESAMERDAEYRWRMSMLRKTTFQIMKKGKCEIQMKNGVKCVITEDPEKERYMFAFEVAGQKIVLFFFKRGLLMALEGLADGHVTTHKLDAILYDEKLYYADSRIGEILRKAIEENVDPRILVAAELV